MVGGFADVSDLGECAGVSISVFVSDFRHCYSITEDALIFNGWPDGLPLDEQEAVVVEAFDTMRDQARQIQQQARQNP